MIQARDLISRQYVHLQRDLHAEPRGYGGRGDKWAGVVLQLAIEHHASSILDYGCGQGSLGRALRAQPLNGMRIAEYDPAIAGKDQLPTFADLVVCTDVLEHIEKDCLAAVLTHLKMLARKAVFIVVSTKESNKTLADGRNAHVIIKPGRWWKQTFREAGFVLHPAPTIVRSIPEREWAVVLTP